MRCIVLAAGFATRLYPLTRNFPKPLLEVGEVTILDRLLSQLRQLDHDGIHVVCNARFATHFSQWCPDDVSLSTNNALHEAQRLGAIGDLAMVLQELQSSGIEDDALVVAADNIFNVNLAGIVDQFEQSGRSCVGVWHNADEQDRKHRGNALLDAQQRIIEFVEKPGEPLSAWSSAPLYLYSRDDLARVTEYLEQGGNADAPGHFLEWLVQRVPVSAFIMAHQPTDIGTLEALASARQNISRS